MLQDPGFVSSQAQRGVSVPTYGYGYNNPIRNTDPTGLFVPGGKCTNWNDAMALARKRAGCGDATQSTCPCTQKLKECTGGKCDICSILNNDEVAKFVKDLECEGHPGEIAAGCSHMTYTPRTRKWSARGVSFDVYMCSGPGGDADIEWFATVILHEAAHHCAVQTGSAVKDTGDCSAANISKACR